MKAVTKIRKAAKADPKIKSIESELIRKHPHIVPGSLLLQHKDFPGKRTVEIKCSQCGKHRRIATQDAFQVKTCSKACKRAAKAEAKAK